MPAHCRCRLLRHPRRRRWRRGLKATVLVARTLQPCCRLSLGICTVSAISGGVRGFSDGSQSPTSEVELKEHIAAPNSIVFSTDRCRSCQSRSGLWTMKDSLQSCQDCVRLASERAERGVMSCDFHSLKQLMMQYTGHCWRAGRHRRLIAGITPIRSGTSSLVQFVST